MPLKIDASEGESYSTNDKKSYARFSLAVDTSFSKEEKDAPMWLSVVAWNSLAEQVTKIVKKGSLVLVGGRLSVRTYTDKEETARTVVEVIAHSVQVEVRLGSLQKFIRAHIYSRTASGKRQMNSSSHLNATIP